MFEMSKRSNVRSVKIGNTRGERMGEDGYELSIRHAHNSIGFSKPTKVFGAK
jgi:hypothetical protein